MAKKGKLESGGGGKEEKEKKSKKDKKEKKEKEEAVVEEIDGFKLNKDLPQEPKIIVKEEVKGVDSATFIETIPEWNSEEVRSLDYSFPDEVKPCIVMLMEEEASLSDQTETLHQLINTGIRKKFAAISGSFIAEKVRRFMTTTCMREVGVSDKSYLDRMDIWAEAIKHGLISYANTLDGEVKGTHENIELLGKRSKELLVPQVRDTLTTSSPLLKASEVVESSVKGSRKSSKNRKSDNEDSGNEKKNTGENVEKKKNRKESDSGSAKSKKGNKKNKPNHNVVPEHRKSRPSLLRKRGEPPLPVLDFIDDAPETGPSSYIILTGFYNPHIIHELHKIGINVDGILMVTNSLVTKRNFSVQDIEEKIPGTFRPPHMLPDYANIIQKNSTEGNSSVSNFWASLVEMINRASTESFLHDIALLNSPLPKKASAVLGDEPIERNSYAALVFDEIANRIYEMMVMIQWYNEYISMATQIKLNPTIKKVPTLLYESEMNQIPSECVTVSMIINSLVLQVEDILEKEKGHGDSGGCQSYKVLDHTKSTHRKKYNENAEIPHEVGGFGDNNSDRANSGIHIPTYIKCNDFATMRACHLNESFAAYIASRDILGNLHSLDHYLWNKMPEFDKGFYLKALSNLSHFMYFLPPGAIRFQDMFFVMHLLMAAGVEAELHKRSEGAQNNSHSDLTRKNTVSNLMVLQMNSGPISECISTDEIKDASSHRLNKSHNYLAVDRNSGQAFVMAPDSKNDLSIKPLGDPERVDGYYWQNANFEDEEDMENINLSQLESARLATDNFVHKAADASHGQNMGAPLFSNHNYFETEGEDFSGAINGQSIDFKDPSGNAYIGCEAEWFKNLSDFSVLSKLLECPALLGMSESGALDVSSWVESHMKSYGKGVSGSGVVIGELNEWKYVEDYAPQQMIQALYQAKENYLCMERIYCPFYDTLLFIFNNPTPVSLKSESEFFTQLKTLPGLQHFLEYTINEEDVFQWIMEMETGKEFKLTDSVSISTLMRIVPEHQWMLIPSIKWTLLLQRREEHRHLVSDFEEDEEEEEEDENDEGSDFGTLKKEKKKKRGDGDSQPGSHKKGKKGRENDSRSSKSGKSASSKGSSKSKEKKKRKSSSEEKGKKKNSKTGDEAPPEHASDASKKLLADIGESPSFNFHNALKTAEKAKRFIISPPSEAPKRPTKFDCYDLGKRVLNVNGDSFHLFPADGTTISYHITSIEPTYRLMQLIVSKNGHSAYFYPYYIPHDVDLGDASYVITPYFHLSHANGTIFGFKDKRGVGNKAKESEMRQMGPVEELNSSHSVIGLFDGSNIVFVPKVEDVSEKAKKEAADESARLFSIAASATSSNAEEIELVNSTSRSLGKDKKEKSPNKTGANQKNLKKQKAVETKEKKKKGGKGEKKGKGKEKDTASNSDGTELVSLPELIESGEEGEIASGFTSEEEESQGTWIYSSSEEVEGEGENISNEQKRASSSFGWSDAAYKIKRMTHSFTISIPSGLTIYVEDLCTSSIKRTVKQCYLAKGSSTSIVESSRYYLANGSVVRFLNNKTFQVINARGVLTKIQKLSSIVNSEEFAKDYIKAFDDSQNVIVFTGSVILPTGEFWEIVNGKRVKGMPLNMHISRHTNTGEIFRKRDDGAVFLDRHDGTTILHYPDGTRFTTRMVVVEENYDKEFDDWVFIGLKTTVENPHYATVKFNSLSANIHIKTSFGDWARVFIDGSVRVGTKDEYKLDVDGTRALLSYPPLPDKKIPNFTAVKLYHLVENAQCKPKTDSVVPIVTHPPDAANMEQNLRVDSKLSVLKTGPSAQGLAKPEHASKKKKGRKKSHDMGRKSENSSIQTKSDEIVNKTSGILKKKSETLEEIPPPIYKHSIQFSPPPPISHEDELNDFLTFKDKWTICKAVDSWDNRFALNIYGASVVDKSSEFKERVQTSVDLRDILSQNLRVPSEVLEGILTCTSSTELLTRAQRLQGLKELQSLSSSKLPKTKILVVKRDLSGHEYLTKTEVETIIRRAKGNPESHVTADPIPTCEARNFITVMEPISEFEAPHGLWRTVYKEPIFRPALLGTKNLLKNPSNLRYFGYILTGAHSKRPKCFLLPKEEFRKRVEESSKVSVLNPESPASNETPQGNNTPHVESDANTEGKHSIDESSKSSKKKKKKGKKGKEKEEDAEKDEGVKDSKVKRRKSKKLNDEDVKSLKSDSQVNKSSDEAKDKKAKRSKKKLGAKKNSEEAVPVPEVIEVVEPPPPAEEIVLEKEIENVEVPLLPEEEEIVHQELLTDDIYGLEPEEEKMMRAMYHPDLVPPRGATVVRTIMEIPTIDENMERALLSASLSYSKAVQGHKELFKNNETHDPRTEEEVRKEKEVREELVKNHPDLVHIHEQHEGTTIHFTY